MMDSGKNAIKLNEASIIDLKVELIKKEKQFIKEQNENRVGEDDIYSTASSSKTFEKLFQNSARRKQRKKQNQVVEDTPVAEKDDIEDNLLLAKSRAALESKANMYEKILQGQIEEPEDETGESKYLVEFYRKSKDQDFSKHEEDEDDSEYTPTLLSADMKREQLREKWEKEQEELLKKGDLSVHYSNVQFDEIREHGVGFFQFSKDQQERQQQMEKLKKLREQTEKQREKREALKERRKAALESRLAKVRQRKYGEEVPSSSESIPDQAMIEQPHEGDKTDEVTERVKTNELVTEEDISAETDKPPKRRKEHLSGLDAWIRSQREDRNPMFAPPPDYSKTNKQTERRRNFQAQK